LREDCGPRVFENRVLRGILGPKRYEVIGKCRRIRNEALNDLYSLPKIVRVIKSRRIKWGGGGNVAHTEERTDVYRVLVEKPEGRSPLG
jgi:hypothetical protein